MDKDNSGSTTTAPSDRGLVITRVFNAPRALVFKAWTDPEHVKRWWGPNESFDKLAESVRG